MKGCEPGIDGSGTAYTVPLGCNLYARSLFNRQQSYDSLEWTIVLDRFEWADHMLSYVLSSMQMEAPTEEILQFGGKLCRQTAGGGFQYHSALSGPVLLYSG